MPESMQRVIVFVSSTLKGFPTEALPDELNERGENTKWNDHLSWTLLPCGLSELVFTLSPSLPCRSADCYRSINIKNSKLKGKGEKEKEKTIVIAVT